MYTCQKFLHTTSLWGALGIRNFLYSFEIVCAVAPEFLAGARTVSWNSKFGIAAAIWCENRTGAWWNVQLLQHVAMLLDHNFHLPQTAARAAPQRGAFCDLAHRSGIGIHCGHNVVFGMRTCCTFMLRNRHLLEPTPSSRLVPARSPLTKWQNHMVGASWKHYDSISMRCREHDVCFFLSFVCLLSTCE